MQHLEQALDTARKRNLRLRHALRAQLSSALRIIDADAGGTSSSAAAPSSSASASDAPPLSSAPLSAGGAGGDAPVGGLVPLFGGAVFGTAEPRPWTPRQPPLHDQHPLGWDHGCHDVPLRIMPRKPTGLQLCMAKGDYITTRVQAAIQRLQQAPRACVRTRACACAHPADACARALAQAIGRWDECDLLVELLAHARRAAKAENKTAPSLVLDVGANVRGHESRSHSLAECMLSAC